MLLAKLFLPMATPGLTSMGVGVLAIASGTYNVIEVIAILFGLMVVAVAGVFTIRSNVAKIWHEQAEAEKARNEELTTQLAELRIETAASIAEVVKENADKLAAIQREANEQREQKHIALTELATANMRTDLTPILVAQKEMLDVLHDLKVLCAK